MADEPNTNTSTNVDPQAAVDAALTLPTSPSADPQPNTQPMMQAEPIIEPVTDSAPTPKIDEAVPEEILAATQTTTPPPTPEPTPAVTPSTGKMAEDMPLAFAGTTPTPPPLPTPTDPNIPPLPTTSTTTTETVTPVSAPKLPEPTYVPPTAGEPVVVKTKKKGKGLKTLVMSLFFLISTALAGIYAYAYFTKTTPLTAIILVGECDPGEEQTRSCTIDGCNGRQTRVCRSNGTFGTWQACYKTSAKCGTDTCVAGASCNTTVNGTNCPGKTVCQSGSKSCVASEKNCGQTKPGCKKCSPTGKECITGNIDQSFCDSAKNECNNNADCGGVDIVSNSCSATKPCTTPGEVCGADNRCADPGGPEACTYKNEAGCTAAGGEFVSEPGGSAYCDKDGHWCAQTRWECKITTAGVPKWCFMYLGTNCSGTVSDKCVSKPSPTPTPKPSPTPSPSPSPSPSPTPKPTLACNSLTKDKVDADITKGTVVKFTCAGAATPAGAVNLTYQFRIRKDAGAWTSLSATGDKASYTVTEYGDYDVQCHACGQIDSASKCDPEWTGATQ